MVLDYRVILAMVNRYIDRCVRKKNKFSAGSSSEKIRIVKRGGLKQKKKKNKSHTFERER